MPPLQLVSAFNPEKLDPEKFNPEKLNPEKLNPENPARKPAGAE